MKNFEYKVSIIVPVYNVEKYVAECLDSLVQQTIDKSQIEILVINDGSTDKSLEICKEYAAIYPFIKLHTKNNEGLSATRNYGIERAKGKYLMYIDSDDKITSETVKEVTDFFDSVYDQVDIVTYLDQGYKFGEKMPLHFRYKYFQKSGVYDLNEFPFLTQTRINICVKNMEDNLLFDTTPGFRQEDQEYNCRVLANRMKIGYCAKGEYQYNRSNETSIMATSYNAIEMFETCMTYFEKLFDTLLQSNSGSIPKYYQAMYIHDLQWKVRENILYPYHYEGKEFENAVGRIRKLLIYVENSVIMEHPNIDNFHRFYWLNMKANSAVAFLGDKQKVALVSGSHYLYKRNKIELILYRIHVKNGKVKILLCAKSPIFSFVDKPTVLAIVNTTYGIKEVEMDLKPSSFNYYRSKTETNSFWTFYFEYEVTQLKEVKFEIEVEGIRYETNYYFMPYSPYDNKLSLYKYIQDNLLIHFRRNVFYFEEISSFDAFEVRRKQTDNYRKLNVVESDFRECVLQYKKEGPIWLYYDCKGVEFDNGYYQFIHDFEKNDGINRYYISSNTYEQRMKIFNEQQMENVITFGGKAHKMLYTHADKIITAFIEPINISPFSDAQIAFYKDLFHFEIIYLQHGILHATLPWKYTPERVNVDKVVVSSYFEIDNFTEKYNFRKEDLLTTGMPRYEYIDKKQKPKNRILFAPTWRNYLIALQKDGTWLPNINRFTKSNYYIEIQAFLNNSCLVELLEKNDLYLDFKLHPIFAPYKECFTFLSNRIRLANDSVSDTDYAIFMTDFSSFVFDFGYLERPIIYFVPDMLEFKAGLNQYRNLDFPFEKAFGRVALSGKEAIEEIQRIIFNEMKPEELYKSRMEKFYLPLENCRDKIYDNLIK